MQKFEDLLDVIQALVETTKFLHPSRPVQIYLDKIRTTAHRALMVLAGTPLTALTDDEKDWVRQGYLEWSGGFPPHENDVDWFEVGGNDTPGLPDEQVEAFFEEWEKHDEENPEILNRTP